MNHRRYFFPVVVALLVLIVSRRAAALQPDEIALIVNSNVPASTELAQFYAQQRHIPDNRILVVDLPTGDDISFDQYESKFVPQVREFLKSGQLTPKIKCFVTFYGVPLRIADRVKTAADDAELAADRDAIKALPDQLSPSVLAVESMAKKLNPEFKPLPNASPDPGRVIENLLMRVEFARQEIFTQIQGIDDKGRQADLASQYCDAAFPLYGRPLAIQKRRLNLASHPENQAVEGPKLKAALDEYDKVGTAAFALEQTRWDPAARAQLRDLARDNFGLVGYAHLIQDQADYITPGQSGSCLDSELSLVMWPVYRRSQWTANPLLYSNATPPRYPTYMVARLDAPTPDLVRSMVTQSIQTEANGLAGRVVLDSLGVHANQETPDHKGYSTYDDSLRNLAALLKTHTKLDVFLDEKPEVIPPNSQKNVALYCGWHSAGQFVDSSQFVTGAVGYHMGSYEMLTLRAPGNNGWVRGFEEHGVVSTLGSVAEPFLQAFPKPDDFFPLVLTGKLTMAEVYWRTVPWTSWQMGFVGDPLYTPYQKNPVLDPLDLPFPLRAALKPIGT